MDVLRHIETLKTIAEDVEPVSRARLAAMILYKGKMVSIGFNQSKSHPFAAKYGKHPEAIYLHAEQDAINKAKRKLTEAELRKATLIVVRVKSEHNGKTTFGIAKPCPGCAQCITDHKIRTVIYTETTEGGNLKYITEVANAY